MTACRADITVRHVVVRALRLQAGGTYLLPSSSLYGGWQRYEWNPEASCTATQAGAVAAAVSLFLSLLRSWKIY